MHHLTYLSVLLACLVLTAPLELVLKARVYGRWRRAAANGWHFSGMCAKFPTSERYHQPSTVISSSHSIDSSLQKA